MSKFMNYLAKVYDRFLLLDLLSYVCPGLIIILAVLFSCQPFHSFTYKLSHFELGFWQGFIAFLFAFVIGLGINQFAQLIIPDIYSECKVQNIFSSWKKENRMKLYTRMIAFIRMDDKDLLSKRERYIIIKQMTRNNGVSILISALIFITDIRLKNGLIVLGVLLLIGSYITLLNQRDFEKTAISGG